MPDHIVDHWSDGLRTSRHGSNVRNLPPEIPTCSKRKVGRIRRRTSMLTVAVAVPIFAPSSRTETDTFTETDILTETDIFTLL